MRIQQWVLVGALIIALLAVGLLYYKQSLLLQHLSQIDHDNVIYSQQVERMSAEVVVMTSLLLLTITAIAIIAYNNLAASEQRCKEAEALSQRLDQALRIAKEANQGKSLFLANMSHEIRTPLNGVLGMLNITLDTKLTGQQREYLQLAKSSADALLVTIGDILDFSRIEAGKLPLEIIPFSLRELVSQTLSPFAIEANERGIVLRWQIADEIVDRICCDPFRLRQILNNLLGNAIKFTDQGEVSLTVSAVEAEPQIIRFAVHDTGIGIDQAQQAVIFEAFTQGNSSTTRRYGGSGLGLSITAALVTLLGGNIWLHSEPGKGSVFYFTLPAVPAEQEAEPPEVIDEPAPHCQPLSILLVEDNLINQRLAELLLRQQGHQVSAVSDGEAALTRLEHEPFDLIFMDIQMPLLDGLATTRRIRQQERQTGQHVPIIAMTANAMESDRQLCLQAGMDGYLSKPIAAGQIDREIARVLTQLQQSQIELRRG